VSSVSEFVVSLFRCSFVSVVFVLRQKWPRCGSRQFRDSRQDHGKSPTAFCFLFPYVSRLDRGRIICFGVFHLVRRPVIRTVVADERTSRVYRTRRVYLNDIFSLCTGQKRRDLGDVAGLPPHRFKFRVETIVLRFRLYARGRGRMLILLVSPAVVLALFCSVIDIFTDCRFKTSIYTCVCANRRIVCTLKRNF